MILNELNIILNDVGKTSNDFDLFIETGSYIGETLDNVKSEFKKLISIEITEKYFTFCKHKFANDINIEMIREDSLIELPKLIDVYYNKKIIFFLDAHYSAGDTGKNNIDVPLIEELKIIRDKYINEGLIIIDDADLFEHVHPLVSWAGINEKNILGALENRVNVYFYKQNIKPPEKKRLIIDLKKW